MYRWQTLTMARVEHLGATITAEQKNSALFVLLAVGTPHFPEPEVGASRRPDTEGSRPEFSVELKWLVDDRVWILSVDPSGTIYEQTLEPEGNSAGCYDQGVKPDDFRHRARWLLFGHDTKPPTELLVALDAAWNAAK